MPVDYNFENTPSFRDLTHTGLLLLKRPLVRSLSKLRRLRSGLARTDAPALVPVKVSATPKTSQHFRRSPLSGSLY